MEKNINLTSYPCPVCSEDHTKHLFQVKGFNLVKCRNCSMVFVNPRIPDKELYTIYADKYFHNEERGYEDYELTALLRSKTFSKWYDEIRRHLKTTDGSALDIGCAAGYFLQVLDENGWEAEGIELEKEMCTRVSDKGYRVYDTPLEYFDTDKKYTLVTLFDVFEHLPNLHTNIKKLTQILADNGSIALVTPNFNSFQRKLIGKRWFQFKPREHIQYFTLQTLQDAVEPLGLHIVHHSASGQYADTSFLYNRLKRYGFRRIANIFKAFITGFGLSEKSLYAYTGSVLVILQKKE